MKTKDRYVGRHLTAARALSVGLCWLLLPVGPAFAQVADVRSVYDGKVLPDLQANTFRNIDKLFPTRVVKRGTTVRPLPPSARPLKDVTFTSQGKTYDLFDYVSRNRVSGLLILKNGQIAFEDYELGNTPTSRWMSMSMAKSITSTLIGAAIKDGHIGSIEDQIVKYLPDLKGSGYDGVSVRQLLQMSSGVQWNETYTDPKSDRRRMLDLQIEQKPGTILKQMGSLPRAAAPGTAWKYSTGETHIAGALLKAAIKMPLSEYLSQKIWSKAGMESDATWWLESPDGLEVGGSGVSATLRDYGRFGLFFLEDGVINKERVLPDGWRDVAGSPKEMGGKPVNYGYMWWPLGDAGGPDNKGAFQATGIFGQHLYINPAEKVVIVVWSARSKPGGSDVFSDADFYAGAVKALKTP